MGEHSFLRVVMRRVPMAGSGPIQLSRGGEVVLTSAGPVQFGAPPETIKDTQQMDWGVPGIFIAPRKLFYLDVGISVAEFEFPVCFNYFVLGRVTHIVCNRSQKRRLATVLQEALFGPKKIDLSREFVRGRKNYRYADLEKEIAFFRRNPKKPAEQTRLADLVKFHTYDRRGQVRIGDVRITAVPHDGFAVSDGGREIARFSSNVTLPAFREEESPEDGRHRDFKPPLFGVTIIGAGSGFQTNDTTTGFILWVNRKGILVDPPIHTTRWLRHREINPRLIDEVVLTHCHADHDAGTIQKVVEAGRITLYTSRTVGESFVTKTRALTGLNRDRLLSLFDFRPVPINDPVRIAGAEFLFHYTLHSIPTIGFEVFFQGKSLVYSSDTLNDPEVVDELQGEGILNEGRRDQLQNFPWHHSIVLHEAGIPPLHTPVRRLADLPDEVKKRLWVLHFDGEKLPEDAGLRVAVPGLEATLAASVEPNPYSKAIELLNVYANVDLFKDFPPSKAAEFLNISKIRQVKKGEKLVEEGEAPSLFSIVLSGKLAIVHKGKDVKTLGYNDYFGESLLVSEMPGSADVVARTDVELVTIGKYDLLYFLRGTDVITILRNLYVNRQLRSWELLEASRTFRHLSAGQKTALQTLLATARFEEGAWLMREGERANACYIVVSGEAEVLQKGKVLAVLRRGDFAGQIVPFRKRWKLDYSFRARKSLEVFRLPLKGFVGYLEDNPGFCLKLANIDYRNFT